METEVNVEKEKFVKVCDAERKKENHGFQKSQILKAF